MFKLEYNGTVHEDYSHDFDVILDKQYTIKQFIFELLENRKDDFGYITVKTIYENVTAEYMKGHIIRPFDGMDGDLIIDKVTASGCFNSINYVIYLPKKYEG